MLGNWGWNWTWWATQTGVAAPPTGQSQYGQPASLPIDTRGVSGEDKVCGRGGGCLSEHHTASMPETMHRYAIPRSSVFSPTLLHIGKVTGSSPDILTFFFRDSPQQLQTNADMITYIQMTVLRIHISSSFRHQPFMWRYSLRGYWLHLHECWRIRDVEIMFHTS
jgi:hypothetical protein